MCAGGTAQEAADKGDVDPLDKKGSVGHQFTTDGKVGESLQRYYFLLRGSARPVNKVYRPIFVNLRICISSKLKPPCFIQGLGFVVSLTSIAALLQVARSRTLLRRQTVRARR